MCSKIMLRNIRRFPLRSNHKSGGKIYPKLDKIKNMPNHELILHTTKISNSEITELKEQLIFKSLKEQGYISEIPYNDGIFAAGMFSGTFLGFGFGMMFGLAISWFAE